MPAPEMQEKLDVAKKASTKIEKKIYRPTESKAETKDYSYLLEKLDMTEKDKENMKKSIDFLVKNKMDTPKNIQKMEAINYGSNYREIDGLKFSREKVVPQVKFHDKPNKYGVFECKEKGIYKTIYNGKDEYHLTTDQYRDQTKKQGIIAIEDNHIRQALQALPGDFSDNSGYIGGNILGDILDLSMSGYVDSDGKLWDQDGYGYLNSASPAGEEDTRAFSFYESKGILNSGYYKFFARPCLFLIK